MGNVSMASADGGTGALYVLLDAIRQKIREKKRREEIRQLEEEAFDEKGKFQTRNFRTRPGTPRTRMGWEASLELGATSSPAESFWPEQFSDLRKVFVCPTVLSDFPNLY